jgi:hypothetical protein
MRCAIAHPYGMDHDHRTATSAAAVHTDPPPAVWGDHDSRFLSRVEPGWVVTTWLLAVVAMLAIAAAATAIVAAVSESPLTSDTNTGLGVLTIIGAMSTFIAFAVVITARLVRVDHDRLSNSLAVAAFHVGVAIVLFAVELVLQGLGIGVADTLEGTWTDEVGNAFTVAERSSAAVILAALLSAGMVPARGGRPTGTQVGPTPQDRQL